MSSSPSHEHSHDEHTHNHEHGGHSHSHEHAGHGHTHEHMEHPGIFEARPLPTVDRDFSRRSFTVGIGGPVGSGKTALLLALCLELRERFSLAAVTNDIFTREDAEFLIRNEALEAERIEAVEPVGEILKILRPARALRFHTVGLPQFSRGVQCAGK